jgi:hypothetical protein
MLGVVLLATWISHWAGRCLYWPLVNGLLKEEEKLRRTADKGEVEEGWVR